MRQDTKLPAQGAEFLVLGHLLVEGLHAYLMYRNMPGFDVLVVNPDKGLQARVSVKSRWRARADGFIIRNFDSDFVIVVKLNKGALEPRSPEFFVIPTNELRRLKSSGWGKLNFNAIPAFNSYLNAWNRIRDFIHAEPELTPPDDEMDEPVLAD